jgi:hypothetical protein
MSEEKIHIRIGGEDSETAYVALPGYRSEFGIVKKTITLDELLEDYRGPRVSLDFDKDGILIGIEILA